VSSGNLSSNSIGRMCNNTSRSRGSVALSSQRIFGVIVDQHSFPCPEQVMKSRHSEERFGLRVSTHNLAKNVAVNVCCAASRQTSSTRINLCTTFFAWKHLVEHLEIRWAGSVSTHDRGMCRTEHNRRAWHMWYQQHHLPLLSRRRHRPTSKSASTAGTDMLVID
jgi:hypothetical protein